MKNLRRWLLAGLLFLTPAAFSQVMLDGATSILGSEEKVRDVVKIKREPVFANAPFLRLRQGDQLVQAKRVLEKFSKPMAEPDWVNYYLQSGDKYYRLGVREENGALLLRDAEACLLFDWEMNLANAAVLRSLLRHEYGQSLPVDTYRTMVQTARERFPKAQFTHPESYRVEEKLLSIPGQTWAEFRGLSYDRSENTLANFVVRIGPAVCRVEIEPKVQGPKRVERWEFEGFHGEAAMVINGPGEVDIDPAVAREKKAAYEDMERFRSLMDFVITKKVPPAEEW